MKYTLGPWRPNGASVLYSIGKGRDVTTGQIAQIYTPNAKDDARLIAAAPELLESLQPTIRLLNTLLEREETMGRKGDRETADWIRSEAIRLMRLENKIRGEE